MANTLFNTIVILLFGQQTFGLQFALLTQLWPWHLVNRHLANIPIDTTVFLSFIQQTFGWQYVLLIQVWPCHLTDRYLANRHLANRHLKFEFFEFSKKNFVCISMASTFLYRKDLKAEKAKIIVFFLVEAGPVPRPRT